MKKIMVVAAVLIEENRILATSRPADKSWADFWEFPGGKIEPGETPAQALRREMREELDLEVVVLDPVYRIEDRTDMRILTIDFFRCVRRRGSQVTPRENQSWQWLDRAAMNTLKWLPLDRDLAEYLSRKG